MTYSETAVLPGNFCYVMDHLWPRGQEEVRRLGIGDGRGHFWRLAHQGRSGCLLANDEPVLLAGICPDGDSHATWFLATAEFDKHFVAITRVLKREARQHKGLLYIYSTVVHPKTERWFKTLGFTKDDWQGKTAAAWPLYRFGR
jgi:hypothetical protein